MPVEWWWINSWLELCTSTVPVCIISCCIKIQNGLPFWYWLTQVVRKCGRQCVGVCECSHSHVICSILTRPFHAGRKPVCEPVCLCHPPTCQSACHHCPRYCPWWSPQQRRPVQHWVSSTEMSNPYRHKSIHTTLPAYRYTHMPSKCCSDIEKLCLQNKLHSQEAS